jgi:DNA-binding response OmpR family regulator
MQGGAESVEDDSLKSKADWSPGAKRKLLLVEDDRPTSNALRGILSLRGWDVTVATTVREGVEAVGRERFSAVVLDLMLPDGDGEAVLDELRLKADPEGPAVPAVVTTGVSDAERIEAVSRRGVAVLLRKPIQLSDLLKAIGK